MYVENYLDMLIEKHSSSAGNECCWTYAGRTFGDGSCCIEVDPAYNGAEDVLYIEIAQRGYSEFISISDMITRVQDALEWSCGDNAIVRYKFIDANGNEEIADVYDVDFNII